MQHCPYDRQLDTEGFHAKPTQGDRLSLTDVTQYDQLRTATQNFKSFKNIYSTGNAFTARVTANDTKRAENAWLSTLNNGFLSHQCAHTTPRQDSASDLVANIHSFLAIYFYSHLLTSDLRQVAYDQHRPIIYFSFF